MAIDWLAASVEQRKALYRAVRRLMAEEAIGWNGIYEAIGRSVPTGGGYEDNFRAGRIARQTANQIYRWLARAYPDHAARLDRDLDAGEPQGERWRSFLQAYGRFERIAAVLLPEPSIGVFAFAKPEPLTRPVIPLGAPFCFEMDSDREGAVIAFQTVGGEVARIAAAAGWFKRGSDQRPPLSATAGQRRAAGLSGRRAGRAAWFSVPDRRSGIDRGHCVLGAGGRYSGIDA